MWNAKLITPCSTTEKYHKGFMSFFPYLLEKGGSNVDYIEGKLFEVPDKDIPGIDKYESVDTGLFYRKLISVEWENFVYEAWCYFLNPDEADDCIEMAS